MSTNIRVQIAGKIATLLDADAQIVCGNSGYTVQLFFDAEWNNYLIKTVRFEWLDTLSGQKRHIDAQYTSGELAIPTEATQDCYELLIGAYAGNLLSSTAARIPCERCCTDGSTFHGDTESPDVYAELLDALQGLASGSIPVRTHTKLNDPQRVGYMEKVTIGG